MEPVASGTLKQCLICLDIISETQNPPRHFGIMENCDHIFCLDCISKWRSNIKVQTFRTCPFCKTYTEFVAPSSSWVESSPEKTELFIKRKETLRTFKAIFNALECIFEEDDVSMANIAVGDLRDFRNMTKEDLLTTYSKKYEVVPPTSDTWLSVLFELIVVDVGDGTLITAEPRLNKLLEAKILAKKLLNIGQLF